MSLKFQWIRIAIHAWRQSWWISLSISLFWNLVILLVARLWIIWDFSAWYMQDCGWCPVRSIYVLLRQSRFAIFLCSFCASSCVLAEFVWHHSHNGFSEGGKSESIYRNFISGLTWLSHKELNLPFIPLVHIEWKDNDRSRIRRPRKLARKIWWIKAPNNYPCNLVRVVFLGLSSRIPNLRGAAAG